jgi:hypothetical protein
MLDYGTRFGDLFQLGYITRDLDQALDHCRNELGLDGFHRSQSSAPVLAGGRVQELKLRSASLNVGRNQIELIQPISGPIEAYTEAVDLEARIINFHHVAIAVRGPYSEFERARAEVAASGDPVAFVHPVDDPAEPMVAFMYVDTRARIGHYTEFLWWSDKLTGMPQFPALD